MSNTEPKTWIKIVPAGVPTNISPAEGDVLSSAFAIQNKTGADLLLGGKNNQSWEVLAGAEFEWSNLDINNSDSNSFTSSDTIYVLSASGGNINILAAVRS